MRKTTRTKKLTFWEDARREIKVLRNLRREHSRKDAVTGDRRQQDFPYVGTVDNRDIFGGIVERKRQHFVTFVGTLAKFLRIAIAIPVRIR